MATCTLKPLPADHFLITSSSQMEVALEAAISLGMRGTINGGPNRIGEIEWRMVVVDLQGNSVAAEIGWVYVWDGLTLISMTQDEFNARYDVI